MSTATYKSARTAEKAGWHRATSLLVGRAMTRDGRAVFNLHEAVINDGETILVGDVSVRRLRAYRKGDLILTEQHLWQGEGWGSHGGDDLITRDPQ